MLRQRRKSVDRGIYIPQPAEEGGHPTPCLIGKTTVLNPAVHFEQGKENHELTGFAIRPLVLCFGRTSGWKTCGNKVLGWRKEHQDFV